MIDLDIETIPGDLERQEDDIKEIIKNGGGKCKLLKDQIVQELGDDKLKYKKVDELKEIWIKTFPEKAAMDEYISRSLNGDYGQICSIAFSKIDSDEIHSFSLDNCKNEHEIISLTSLTIASLTARKDGGISKTEFVGHNIPFDLQFLFKRCVLNKIRFPQRLPFQGWHGKDYFCTSQAWSGKERISQDKLCNLLGIEGKPNHIDGSKVYDYALEGRYAEIEEYNRDDVLKNKLIYKTLKEYV